MADPEMDALNDPDTMNTASTDNDLQDAQLDDSLAPEHYEASDLKVLEGLENWMAENGVKELGEIVGAVRPW